MQVSDRHSCIRERPERYYLESWSGTCLQVQKLPDPTFGCARIAVGTADNGHQRQTSQHPDSVPGPSPKCGSQQSLEPILATSWKLSQQATTSWVLPACTACLLLFLHLWCAPYADYFRVLVGKWNRGSMTEKPPQFTMHSQQSWHQMHI